MNFDIPRQLHSDEVDLVNFILSAQFTGVEALREQVSGLRAVGKCECGCPTIDLAADPNAIPADGLGQRVLPIEAVVRPGGDEPPGEVIIFADDGLLSGLEYVYYSEAPPAEWPDLERLKLR